MREGKRIGDAKINAGIVQIHYLVGLRFRMRGGDDRSDKERGRGYYYEGLQAGLGLVAKFGF